MSEENDMKMLEARLAAVEAKVGSAQTELNTEGMISFPMFDVGMPPIVPIGGGSGGMFEWDAEKKQIGAGGVMVGGHWVPVAASSENLRNGDYAVKVTLGEEADTAEIAKSGMDSDTVRYIPIYTVADGEVTDDMRWAFVVQAWE